VNTRQRLRAAMPLHCALFAAALIAGCAASPEAPRQAKTPEAPRQAKISDEVVAEASVLAVDAATRELTLKRADGTRVVVVAGPEVRNFAQIKVGDMVTARYIVSLSARRLAADEPDTEPSLGVAAARAKPGERPAGAIGADVAMTVVVKSVDLERHVVVFTDPGGALHAVEAERDVGRRFIAGLSPGDRVELVYAKVFVLGVE